MAFVITRLCRDCVDGACVDVCPTDCILEHRPAHGESHLPRQLFINPSECIDCSMCAPECPWEAIFPDVDVPDAFHEDIALNALAKGPPADFHVPTQRLLRRPSAEEIDANRLRWEPQGEVSKLR
jgi:ferredoxin